MTYPFRFCARPAALVVALLSSLLLATASAQNRPAPFVGNTLDGLPCRGVSQNYGPWDYRQRQQFAYQIEINERFHFSRKVETLASGESAATPDDDLRFMLKNWPNHHRVLNSVSRYQIKLEKEGKSFQPPAECWFQRAINYVPDDPTVMMLYGIHLHRLGENEKATKAYREAEKLAPGDPQISYNYGLLLADMEQYEEARVRAHEVYAVGYPLPGLKNKLQAAGEWK